mgnify:CR=1 FL=1
MKKILSIASVAILTASTLFAGVTGNANVAFGYDTTSKEYGFKNSTGLTVDVDLATAEAEAKGEGDIYAGIKTTMNVKVGNYKYDSTKSSSPKGDEIWQKDGKKMGIGIFFDFAEAYVAGQDWKVSILGSTDSANDFAKSAIDTKKAAVKDIFGNVYSKKNTAVTYKPTYGNFDGIEATVKGYKLGLGLVGNAADATKYFATSLFGSTPDIAIADGLTVKAGAEYAYSDKTGSEYNSVGGSVKVAYENDAFKVSAASDMGYDIKAEKFGVDVAANFKYSPVTLDVYYANDVQTTAKVYDSDSAAANTKNLLSAKAVVDLNAFDVPVALTVTGKDLVNKQNLSVKGAFNITEELSADATVGYVINTKKLSTSANVAYKADAFTAKAGAAFSTVIDTDNKMVLSATASIESTALVPGATLALTYDTDSDDTDMNFLKNQATAQNFGAVTASCKISF